MNGKKRERKSVPSLINLQLKAAAGGGGMKRKHTVSFRTNAAAAAGFAVVTSAAEVSKALTVGG